MRNLRRIVGLIIILLFAKSALASESLPVAYHHYLNVLRVGDGSIQVQSRIVDRLDVAHAKIEILATASIKKFGIWQEAKYEGGSIRVRITIIDEATNDEAGTLRLEFARTHHISKSEVIEFSGVTRLTDPGE